MNSDQFLNNTYYSYVSYISTINKIKNLYNNTKKHIIKIH